MNQYTNLENNSEIDFTLKRAGRGRPVSPPPPFMILSTTLHALRFPRTYIETTATYRGSFVTKYSS